MLSQQPHQTNAHLYFCCDTAVSNAALINIFNSLLFLIIVGNLKMNEYRKHVKWSHFSIASAITTPRDITHRCVQSKSLLRTLSSDSCSLSLFWLIHTLQQNTNYGLIAWAELRGAATASSSQWLMAGIHSFIQCLPFKLTSSHGRSAVQPCEQHLPTEPHKLGSPIEHKWKRKS